MASSKTVQVTLGKPHAAIMAERARFFDVEGALRSAKTWTILMKIRTRLEGEPGIKGFISRWTEGDLNNKLIPDWRRVCQLMHVSHGAWNAREDCFEFPNGSVLYAIPLKSNQKDNRYAKVRGLTVAFGYIDQAEEVPEDVVQEAALRLSQPGYWQQLILSPNPVPETHWLARMFPASNSRPDHKYQTLSIWDNAHNLDPATIRAAEALYPVGHPQRGVKLEGRRGLDVRGVPVYNGAFNRAVHLAADTLPFNPSLPLIESLDFGYHHPCVTWYQYAPWGLIRAMGGLLGVDMHLHQFLQVVQRFRDTWFPRRTMLLAACDPAGANENAQGIQGTPVQIVRDWYREHGDELVNPQFIPDANQPEKRVMATQMVATYMGHTAYTGDPGFLVDPERWRLVWWREGPIPVGQEPWEDRYDAFFVDGLEAGYVLEDEPRHSARLGTYWVPKKDGFYEHPMNTLEYAALVHMRELPLGEARQPQVHQTHLSDAALRQALQARRELREQQRDTHPIDRLVVASSNPFRRARSGMRA